MASEPLAEASKDEEDVITKPNVNVDETKSTTILAKERVEVSRAHESNFKEEAKEKLEDMDEVDLRVAVERSQTNGKFLAPPSTQVLEFRANGKTLNDIPIKPRLAGEKDEPIGYMRHIIALLALSSIVLANANRQAFNQALVSMTRDKPAVPATTTTSTTTPTPEANDALIFTMFPPVETTTINSMTTTIISEARGDSELTTQYDPIEDLLVDTAAQDAIKTDDHDDKFDWTPKQIALLQSAFSYGYTPFMIPGGRMCEVYGAKWVVFASGFGSALCCLFAPFFADWNYNLLVVSRILMGLCQTGVSPALYALLARWLPSDESSVYLPMIKVAVQLGFMAGSLFSGFFTWRMTFFQVGIIGVIWSAIWVFFVSSEPKEHKFLSKNELLYIQREIGKQTKSIESSKSKNSDKKQSAPWLAIATNPMVLAFMFSKFTVKLSTDTQSMQIPMYLSKVFHVSQELVSTV